MPKNVSVSFEKLVQPLQKLMRWSVPALFFLTPLVFAPFTTEALEMNKQVILFVFVFAATLGWLGTMIAERQVRMRGGLALNIVPMVFLAVMLVSTILSAAGLESWLGYGGQEYVSFLTAACGVVFFYMLVNSSDTALARQSLIALLLSSSIVGLITLCSLVGINLVPFAFTHVVGFNTIGNVNALIAWLIPIALIGIGFYMVDSDDESSVIPAGPFGVFMRLLIAFVTLTVLLLLVAVDFWTLWAPFMIGLAALIFMSFLEPSHFPNMRRLAVPGVIFAIAVLFLFVKTPLKIKIPVVVSPSAATSWSIAMDTLKQGPAEALFGSAFTLADNSGFLFA